MLNVTLVEDEQLCESRLKFHFRSNKNGRTNQLIINCSKIKEKIVLQKITYIQ